MGLVTIHQIIELLLRGLRGLGAQVNLPLVESLAVTIHRIVSVETRQYHSLEHIVTLADTDDPAQVLVGLFHDLVYCQIDQVPLEVQAVIAPYVYRQADVETLCAHVLTDRAGADDRLFEMTIGIFGFSLGEPLPVAAGLNEFLSALFMNLSLGEAVAEKDLARMTACIEATIPFRGPDEQGRGPLEHLADRLGQVNERFALGMTAQDLDTAVQGAARFANRDVSSFADPDVARFLDDTWKLLPESSAALRPGYFYSIREFREALWRMKRFFDRLDPETIFHAYKGVPSEETLRGLVERARRNVLAAREYLEVKLVTLALLEALAEISGGDAPLSLFTGMMEAGPEQPRLENFLPPVGEVTAPLSPEVLRLLQVGRTEASFDSRRSPLGLFLYRRLGQTGVDRLWPAAEAFFSGELGVQEFLARVEGPVIVAVARACAAMVSTRQDLLLRYARERAL